MTEVGSLKKFVEQSVELVVDEEGFTHAFAGYGIQSKGFDQCAMFSVPLNVTSRGAREESLVSVFDYWNAESRSFFNQFLSIKHQYKTLMKRGDFQIVGETIGVQP